MRLEPPFKPGHSLDFSISLDSLQGYCYLLCACEFRPGSRVPDPGLHGGKILMWPRAPRHQPLAMKRSGKEGSRSYLQQGRRQPSFSLFFFFKCPKINASIGKYFCSISGEKERDGWLKPVYISQKNNKKYFRLLWFWFLKIFWFGIKAKKTQLFAQP